MPHSDSQSMTPKIRAGWNVPNINIETGADRMVDQTSTCTPFRSYQSRRAVRRLHLQHRERIQKRQFGLCYSRVVNSNIYFRNVHGNQRIIDEAEGKAADSMMYMRNCVSYEKTLHARALARIFPIKEFQPVKSRKISVSAPGTASMANTGGTFGTGCLLSEKEE